MRKKPPKQDVPPPKHYQAITTRYYQPESLPAASEAPEALPKKRTARWKKFLLFILILLLSACIVIVIWNLRNFQNASKKLFETDSAWSVLQTQELKRDTNGRTNLLVVGYSIDDPNHGGAELTDSILIVSLDRDSQTGYMLSVPRDLYVAIPGYGNAKINEAYQAGNALKFKQAGYPSGGMGLLQKVVHDTLGTEIHYNALVNYTAVREIVDALGGINVTIKSSDPRGIYDPNFPKVQGGPLKLTNGTHHIDGQTALRLTRARGSTYGSYGFPLSDFNRTQHQQQVFRAIQAELTWRLILDPRTNGKIFDAVGENVETNVSIHEAIPLYRLFSAIPSDKLKSISLRELNGVNLLTGYSTATGQSALVPTAGFNDYSEIRAHIKKLSNQQ